MRAYEFEMTSKGERVAIGTASGTLLYEFQKTHMQASGCGVDAEGEPLQPLKGDGFQPMGAIYTMGVGVQRSWFVEDAVGNRFGFWCKRLN